MKQVAILISGHTRDFETTLPGLVYLKQQFDADVFISSYTRRGIGVRFWQGQNQYIDTLTDQDYQTIQQQLDPITVHYDEELVMPEYIKDHQFQNAIINTEGVYSMFYKFWHANELKKQYESKHNGKYPIVIRTRFDNEYLTIDLKEFKQGSVYTGRADIKTLLTDSFFVCDSDSMDILADIKNQMCKSLLPSNFHNAEHMFTHYLVDKGLTPVVDGSVKIRLRDKLFA